MKKGSLALVVVLGVVSGFVGAWLLPQMSGGNTTTLTSKSANESAYDRVMRTQTLRCGYVVWTPALMKDPNTGKLSGLFYDYTEALGQALHLKIEWTEEMNWGDFPAALNSGRIDAMCGGSWPNAARARVIDFVRPILYAPTYAWVRTDDKRFDNNIEAINDPGVSIVVIEGSTPAVIATQDFPKAKLIQLPAITSLAEGFVSLADGKADVTIQSASAEHQYDVNNPGKIRRIEAKMPLRLGAQCMAIAGGQDRLRRMLDLATDEMITSGQVEKIIAQYDDVPGAILRVAPSYKTDAVK